MSDETYNGWKNYPTWCVYTHLANEEHSYRHWRDAAGDEMDEADGDRDRAARELGNRIRTVVRELTENYADSYDSQPMLLDLLDEAAGRVHWQDVAAAFLPENWEPPHDESKGDK